MRILVAPDSFKGSASAIQVANAIEKGILKVFSTADIRKVPIADGGEGTVEAMVMAAGGRIIQEEVIGPLGNSIKSYWGILGDNETAVIEMAAASGLTLVPKEQRNPRITTTYGTGQLIKAALNKGLRKIIIGIGGSATNDGGSGMANALGIRFLDKDGRELTAGGLPLNRLAHIDVSGIDPRLADTNILVACDVDNPLCGPHGASTVYGPQKGATAEMVAELDAALENYAEIATSITGRDIAKVSGAGAAGGLGAGLLFFTNALLRPGVEIILETANFNELVQQAQLVITGEGRTDFQTAYGKAPVGVAKLAKQHNVATVCLSGGLGDGYETVLKQGIDAVMSIAPAPMELEKCIENAESLIESATVRLCQLVGVGMRLQNT